MIINGHEGGRLQGTVWSAHFNLTTGEVDITPKELVVEINNKRGIKTSPKQIEKLVSRVTHRNMSPREQFLAVEGMYIKALTPLIQRLPWDDERVSRQQGSWENLGIPSKLPEDILYQSACAFLFDASGYNLLEASQKVLSEALLKSENPDEINNLVIHFSEILDEYWPEEEGNKTT